MGIQHHHIRTADAPMADLAPAEILQWALAHRDVLLRQRPDMEAFQSEIDRLLIHSGGDAGNRMAVLEILMEAHLMTLHGHLAKLLTILE